MLFADQRCYGAILLAGLATSGCGGKTHADVNGSQGGSTAEGGSIASAGNSAFGGGAAAGGASAAGGGSADCPAGGRKETLTPRDAVAGASTQGCGECAGRTLGDIVALIQDDYGELADITTFYEPSEPGVDSKVIYAFPTDTGFRLVFSKGDGDCEAGCINREYWYVQTASFCYPYAAGWYSRTFDATRNCFRVEGEPLWGFPVTAVSGVCDAEPTPQNVAGDHVVTARGDQQACSRMSAPTTRVVRSLTLHVEQDDSDLERATVSISGANHARLDGATFVGEIHGSELSVSVNRRESGGACVDSFSLELRYDFKLASGSLRLEEAHTPDCAAKPDEYCKGFLNADLGP